MSSSSSEAARAAAALLSEPDAIDRGIAMFVLVSGVVYLAVASVAMVLFYRERNAFEIRARSAYLSLLNGLCFTASLAAIIVRQLPDSFLELEINIYAIFTVYFFLSVCNTCCYWSRTIRLLVLYSPQARKAAPWLIPERNHVIVCLLLGAASTAVPLYDMAQVGDGPLAELEFYVLISKHYWIVLFASQAVLLLLNPIAWFIDDLFGVGPELRAMMIAQLLTIVTGRLAEAYAEPDLLRWISAQKVGYLGTVVMVSISIVLPIRRRLLHPLQSSDPKVLKAQALRRAVGAEWGTSGGPFVSGGTLANDDDDGSLFCSAAMASATHPSSASSSPGSWTYERVMSTPETAAAFEEFSRKALCQESVLFLKDVATFQVRGFGDVEVAVVADDSKDGREGGNGTDADGSNSADGRQSRKPCGEEEQFLSFSKILREYIADGAPNEINISCNDKNDILDVYNNKRRGDMGFRDLPVSERRLVFARAYAEIRYMLESNLMLKFVSTDEFDRALTATRQKQAHIC